MKTINPKLHNIRTKPYRTYLGVKNQFDYTDVMQLANTSYAAPSTKWKYNAMLICTMMVEEGLAKVMKKQQFIKKSGRLRRVLKKTPFARLDKRQRELLYNVRDYYVNGHKKI